MSTLRDNCARCEQLLHDFSICHLVVPFVEQFEEPDKFRNRLLIHLSGCDDQRKSPTNATSSQTYSGVVYVLKCLIDPDIPVNDGFYRLIVSFGYMESPLLLPVLRAVSQAEHIPLDPDDATYYIGHETIVAKDGGINRVPEAIFSYLNRNAVHEERRYGMPTQQIVEIGTQINL